MALVDMKRTKKPKKDSQVTMGMDESKYPWGLSITLEMESLEKLNIDVNQLKVGQVLNLMADAEITSISVSEDMNKERKSLGLQITRMDLNAPKGKNRYKDFMNKRDAGPGE